jgi:hypothetical protein
MRVRRRQDGGGSSGAALVVVFVSVVVLSILAAGIMILFRANIRSQAVIASRMHAMYAAESGVSLAMHYLALETDPPAQGLPWFLPGDSLGWIDVYSGGERALVVVDPMDGASGDGSLRSVEIRSRGRSGSEEVDVVVRATPDTPSRYALLVDGGISGGYLTDGLELEGPVHANGIIEFSSLSPDSTGDPVIPEVSTTGGGGFRFSDVGLSDDPHPVGSRVWVRPWRTHASGTPSWNRHADPIDFGRIAEHFRGLLPEASSMGTYRSGVQRVLLDGDRVLLKKSVNSVVDTVQLGEGRDLLYLDSPGLGVLVRSRNTLSVPLTIVCTGPVGISGHIDAYTTENGGPLGIVSLSDIEIVMDPGEYDWLPPWDISTDGNVTVRAFLAAPTGGFRAQNIFQPGSLAQLTLVGGLMAGEFGPTGTSTTGYWLSLVYDTGLAVQRPPHFPLLEHWKVSSWEFGAGIAGEDIAGNRY